MRAAWYLLMVLLGLLLAGMLTSCGGKSSAASGPSAVFVLFDVSGSTSAPQIRRLYFQDYLAIVNAMGDGDAIMGDVITDNTMATSTYPIHQTLPHYDMLRYSKLTFDEALHKVEAQVRTEGEKLILHSNSTPSTDLMNAFQLADKIFNGEDWRASQNKRLVVFSDMVEQSHHYDFTVENLDDAHIQQIIAQERANGRLPNLHGVKVWVAGATLEPTNGLPPAKIYQIQNFWLHYFKACGADIDESRYATRLINFRLH